MAMLFYGHLEIKFEFPFCQLVKAVTTKCILSLLISHVVSPWKCLFHVLPFAEFNLQSQGTSRKTDNEHPNK